MPRLNIYLNDDIYALADHWREKVSLSEICSKALLDELSALNDGRDVSSLASKWRGPTELEAALADRFSLRTVVVVPATDDELRMREQLGQAAAQLVDEIVADDSRFLVCGGRQTWQVIRNMSPRRVKADVFSLGYEPSNSRLQHVHSNSLSVIVSLLYQPRSSAYVISPDVRSREGLRSHKKYSSTILLASCSGVDLGSEFYVELGESVSNDIADAGATGEYAYNFFDDQGVSIEPKSLPARRVEGSKSLNELAGDERCHVFLVAGGGSKFDVIRLCVSNRLCNTLVTDLNTARNLLSSGA